MRLMSVIFQNIIICSAAVGLTLFSSQAIAAEVLEEMTQAEIEEHIRKEEYTKAQLEYAKKLMEYHKSLVPAEAKFKIQAFHRAVEALNKEAITLSLCYPVKIMFRDRQIKLYDKQEFLQHFNAIFTTRFIHTLKQIDWTPSVIGDKGITIGGGQIWFDMNGCVLTFNNNLYVM